MKILRLDKDGLLEPLIATLVDKNEKLYYNIHHGDSNCWQFRCSIDSRISFPKKDKKLILKEDHYILREIRNSDDELIVDMVGNVYYVISKNSNVEHKQDLLLFWYIPTDYKDVTYEIEGFVTQIGIGYNGVKDTPTPAPILEIYGDCRFSMKGLDKNGQQTNIKYAYDYDQSLLKRI